MICALACLTIGAGIGAFGHWAYLEILYRMD